jgi:universal stress protein A
MSYTHILIPTDFSTTANEALRLAFAEAMQHQAQLTLLHVLHHQPTEVYYVRGAPNTRVGFEIDSGSSLPSPQMSTPETVIRDYNEEALTQLRDLVPASFTGQWQVQVATGDPADAIVRVARELGAELIVMGTHGRTGLQHVLLGSVAEKVVRHALCPVLTVRHRAQTV